MEPPPIQYVRTPDGFDIAYTDCGEGLPFVFVPWPFSNMSQIWHTRFGRPLLDALSARFRLIQYDSRGQGMSTRGLPEYHSIDDYLQDLEAVLDRLNIDQAVLYGGPIFCHVAVRFAVLHPERVLALVLGDINVTPAGRGPGAFETLAREDWDTFLHTYVASFSLHGAPKELPYWRESIDQADWLRMLESVRQSDLGDLLPRVIAPALILNNRRLSDDEPVSDLTAHGQLAASLIPDSRLVLFDRWASVWYSEDEKPPQAVITIESFLRDLSLIEEQQPAPARHDPTISAPGPALSPRELQILRLIAQGRSNQEIAADLVLSVRTVERHITNLYRKIGARRKADATAFALRNEIA